MGVLTVTFSDQVLFQFDATPNKIASLMAGAESANIPVTPREFAIGLIGAMLTGATPAAFDDERLQQGQKDLITYLILTDDDGAVANLLQRMDVKAGIVEEDEGGGAFHFEFTYGSTTRRPH